MDWFRSWHGAPTDNKWLPIAKRAGVTPMMVSAVFWALLDYASQQEERGSVEGFDVETYAMWAGCEEAEVSAILDAMRAKGVITDGETLAAWDKRQPKREREDDSTERVRRYRENVAMKHHVTPSNANGNGVTPSNAPREEKIREDTEQSREDSDTDKNRPEKEPEPTAQPARSHARAFTDAEVQQVARYLESNGIALTPFVVDSYMEAVQDYGIQATVAGIQAAAENGKQQKMKYVLACIRNKAHGNNGNGYAPLAALASVQLPPELAAMMGA